jgi:hypothetical protein
VAIRDTGEPEVLPPRRVRRFTGPLLIGAVVAAALALLPVLVVVAAVVSVFLPGRWRALRLLAFALVYLVLEVAGLAVAAVLWVFSGFGRRLHTPRARAAHYTVLRLLLDTLMRVASGCSRCGWSPTARPGRRWTTGHPVRRTPWSCCLATPVPATRSCSCTR